MSQAEVVNDITHQERVADAMPPVKKAKVSVTTPTVRLCCDTNAGLVQVLIVLTERS
jgi:hypothetical protein